VIYLDTSVALAHLLGEDRYPPAEMWREPIVASRLLQYDLSTRLNARKLGPSHAEAARILVGRVALLELTPVVLERALQQFPVALRTLDALHLASIEFLRKQGVDIELACYDERMLDAAKKLKIPLSRYAE
jgi:predicted nucleic acid-binding protein